MKHLHQYAIAVAITVASLTSNSSATESIVPQFDDGNLCLTRFVANLLRRGNADEALRNYPGFGLFYLPGAQTCEGHGSSIPRGRTPTLIKAYWEYQAQHGQTPSCPPPFSPVSVVAYTAATGCRPVENAGAPNACALYAYTGGETTNPHSVMRDPPNGITDVEFATFARFHVAYNPNLYPEQKCF